MHFLQLNMLFIIIAILAHHPSTGIQLPDVYWNPDEPMFNQTQCQQGSREIFVKEYDTINIVCANRDLNNAVKSIFTFYHMFCDT